MTTRILIFGATGYIGGSILARLLEHPKNHSFEITAVLRSEAKAKDFESFGIKTVIGSLDNDELLERVSAEADIVIQSVSQISFRSFTEHREIGRCRSPAGDKIHFEGFKE